MKIYLVRHAETDANTNGILQGQRENLQLNEYGVREATRLKQKLKDISFDACYTSPPVSYTHLDVYKRQLSPTWRL